MTTPMPEFEGLCPVALAEGTDFQGSQEFQTTIGEKNYLFGSADGKALFDSNPQAILDQISR